MAGRVLNLIALSSLAILACSFGASPVAALSVDTSALHARQLGHHHQLIAKKKRQNTGRCKQRSPQSSTSASASAKPTPAAPSPSPSPSPSKAPAQSSSGGGKVGIGSVGLSAGTLGAFKTSKVSASYTWSPWKADGADALGLESFPMLWGPDQIGDFTNLVKAGYANNVLGPNEPDLAGQSNLSPSYVAQLWWQYIEPLKNEGYNLISPAVSSGSSGKQWMIDWIAACSGCTINGIALHWYGTDPQAFIEYITDFHNTFQRPIYVTEVACQNFAGGAQCTEDQVTNFMSTTTSFMDNTDWVSKYFFFGVMYDMQGVNQLDQLLGSNNQPTALGWQLIQ